jgi:hypothetical protein
MILQRQPQDPHSTPGLLADDNGTFLCRTLELPVRDGLPGSAIPAGKYPVVLAPSPKFMKSPDAWVQLYASQMPHVVDIPNRSLIMVHFGNFPKDTDGCILVGGNTSHIEDAVSNSRAAFAALYIKIQAWIKGGGCWLEVLDAPTNAGDVQDALTAT